MTQLALSGDALVVHERPVGAVEVFQEDLAVSHEQSAMALADNGAGRP